MKSALTMNPPPERVDAEDRSQLQHLAARPGEERLARRFRGVQVDPGIGRADSDTQEGVAEK